VYLLATKLAKKLACHVDSFNMDNFEVEEAHVTKTTLQV
jgi:hypothetical protein